MSNWRKRFFDHCSQLVRCTLPSSCALCGAAAEHGRFCAPCDESLPRLTAGRCGLCAVPLPSGATCGACLGNPPLYDNVCAAYAYAFPVDALIHAYKYHGKLALAPTLASALAGAAAPPVDALLPMPLAAQRLRERGYNQAQELARIVGRTLRLPVLGDACRRVAHTPPQAALPWKERIRNVRGAFVCDADLRGKRIAVIDDVMTSGATMNELARNLKQAGAELVSAWVVARTAR